MWQDRNRDAGKCSQYRLPEQDGEQGNQDCKPSSAQAPGQDYDPIRLSNGRTRFDLVLSPYLDFGVMKLLCLEIRKEQ